jgi:hypothetical protein
MVYGQGEETANCTVVVEKNYAMFRPSWYAFHPMGRTLFMSLSTLCIVMMVVALSMVVIHVTVVARNICHGAWDQVCERYIGSEDEHPEYLEDIDGRGVGKKPIFDWGNAGIRNPHVYKLDRAYLRDSMDVYEQKQVHVRTIQSMYLSRNRGLMFIGFHAMTLVYTTMSLLGYTIIPGMGLQPPESMEFMLVTVFLPQSLLLVFFLYLGFQNEYQYHNTALYATFVVVLCFQTPGAMMSLTMVPKHMSPMMVAMNWMLVLMAFRHTLAFPLLSGRGELKQHIRHYVRAHRHMRNLDETERSFVIKHEQHMEERNQKRSRMMLPPVEILQ